MSEIYHTPYIDGTTEYKHVDMNVPLGELDAAIDKARGPKYYDHIGQYLGDKPNSAGLLMRAVVSRYMELEAGAAKSELYVGTVPTSAATFVIKRNGSQIGTISVSAGKHKGSFTVASTVAFYHSDLIELLAPNPQDATLQDVSWNIVLKRPDVDDMTTTTTTTTTTTSTTSTTTTV